ncbi:glutaredoxin domain-containing protein [Rubrivivax albus]|uniref:Glutaredoxin family protein n=1 Tax=Rubrivivax albus TaxID=2499835 RepID=A0A437JNX3_9BURK|nr:glutaredoxin domain-containing protein [Rubrivivax albus]RVT48488.1 glutaredoxin family protein [Rubrivivax albus]
MRTLHALSVLSAALLLAGAGPAAAQYKVVGPDGRVTYTDRPPADGSVRVTEIGRRAPVAEPAAGSALPADLQRTAARFPVTLFTAENCPPCDSGRDLLKQRGVPYTERQIVSNDDVAALERTIGGRTVPSLTVGGQALRGFSAGDWTSYLDAAGYPRESRLPRTWAPPAPTPLVARAPLPAPAPNAPPVPPPAPATPVDAETGPEGTTGIRF